MLVYLHYIGLYRSINQGYIYHTRRDEFVTVIQAIFISEIVILVIFISYTITGNELITLAIIKQL